MTRFEMDFSGINGEFWKREAEKEIQRMQELVDNDEICTNMNGGAFWNCNNRYLSADACDALAHTTFEFSVEETNRAREEQIDMEVEAYLKSCREPRAEQRTEMRAAFGTGTTVVDIITGKKSDCERGGADQNDNL